MPQSPVKPESPATPKDQCSLHAFYPANQDNDNGDGGSSEQPKAAKAKYRLHTTKVKKKIGNTNDNDDDKDKSAIFVTGKLKFFSSESQTYQVKWEPLDDDNQEGADENGTTEETWTTDQVDFGVALFRAMPTVATGGGGVIHVNKWFVVDDEDVLYKGVVADAFRSDDGAIYFPIVYTDNDEEDYDSAELAGGVQLYMDEKKKEEKKKKEKPKKKEKVSPKPNRKRTASTAKKTKKESESESAPAKKNKRTKKEPDVDEDMEDNDDDDSAEPVVKEEEEEGATTGRRSRRCSKVKPSYNDPMSENETMSEDEDEDDDNQGRNKKPTNKKPNSRNKKRAPKRRKGSAPDPGNDGPNSDDDGSYEGGDDDDDDAEADDNFDENVSMNEDTESEEETTVVAKSNARRGNNKKAKKAATTTTATTPHRSKSNKNSTLEEIDLEFKTKLAKDIASCKPQNNPLKMPAEAFVDPVGVDPTHGIVEGIIAAQVRKVGGLLLGATRRNQSDEGSILGEINFPIKLQTACSGTDAPSIALGLIKESLDKMLANQCEEKTSSNNGNSGTGNINEHGFDYSHQMSCEIETFKQAYIGRNFPGVPLFPDITKLTASKEVLDVYGRPQEIPEGNLFVAGTSCKDFSMLKSRDRMDIEDKGTSGETFLAACEFLQDFQPPMAIFENVDGAPWEKMQEYIRGRVDLSLRNTMTAIKDSKKGGDADNLLKFSVNENGRYVAEEIPRQVGIRAGGIVQGIVRFGDEASNVTELVAPAKKASSTLITLGELAKRHNINLGEDTLVMVKKANYCTKLVKLDTKNYGLPQTRNRKYLFIWRSDDPADDLGDYFKETLEHLQTPLLHSMDAFLLPDTHDRIRCFREALRSGPGLLVKRDRAKELDFWDFEQARIKDVTCHMAFREANGIEEKARWLTGWDTRGRKLLAPGLWPELVDCWNMRRLDLIDCFGVAAVRDAISRDPLHHSFTWDLSQNVTRTQFRNATVGVAGCVTPGGEMLLAHKGRTVMGYEKLLLQGIPFSRLLLGPESEVQLSDLAGNAMSVSVISAVMLSAFCAPELRRQRMQEKNVMLTNFAVSQKYDAANGAVQALRGDLYQTEREKDAKSLRDVFGEVAKDLALDAFRSSVLCTCESSGTTTSDPKILECTGCGMGVCHGCSGRYRVFAHVLEEIHVEGETGRPDPHAFERKLRCAVPSTLRLGEGWEDALESGEGLESYSFQLQQVDRKKGHWVLTYGAYEDHGSARQIADIRVKIGKIDRDSDGDYGVAAYIRCFAPSIRHTKPLRGKLEDSARLVFKLKDSSSPCWEVPAAPTKRSLQLVGSDPCDSPRVQVGLNDKASKSLKAHKPMKAFIPAIQSTSRNNLLAYHPKWKTFPGTIVVSGDSSDQVNGTYLRLTCQQTVVLSAIWRRDGDKDTPPMHIYIRPDVIKTGLDVAVISPTPSYADGLEVCELHDWIPENTFVESTHETKATFLNWESCSESLKVEVPKPKLSMTTQPTSFHEKVNAGREQDASKLVLCEMSGLSSEVARVLLEHNEENNHIIDLQGRSGTRNAKRLGLVAAPSLVKSAAEGKLPLSMSTWYRLPASPGYGCCEINVPPRPIETWKALTGRKVNVERIYDGEESNEYYQMLQNRPAPFQVSVDESQGKLAVCMNPYVAAHRAAALLGGESAGPVNIDFCLSELSSMGEPDTKVFQVPNSDAYEETIISGMKLPLYKRQAKALTRMLAIESGEVLFSEEERSEHLLSGIGWCMIARASKKSPLRGGVLGDAIGSGKTVITIGLILAGVQKARADRDVKKGKSSATLIVVPPGLVQQWDDERRKFTNDKLKCIIIDCTATLKNYTVEDICSADIVIVPAGIIEEAKKTGNERPYTEHLSKKAGAGVIPRAPQGYSQREAPTIEGTWIRNMASGPDIYVGNKGNQRTRDAQAYYGHCYSEAIAKLRQKEFGSKEKGIPIEYFTWERIIIDECHETLVTGKSLKIGKDDNFKEKARRGAREFLGVAQTDVTKRPLVASTGVWGLTGTPLLETDARVTELANLMGGTYLTGASCHWRKEERESGRDLFLNQQEGTRSREYRCAVQEACHLYVREACQRNRGEKLNVKLTREQIFVNMTSDEGEAFERVTKDIGLDGFAIPVDSLGEKTDKVLSITASSEARHGALCGKIEEIQKAEPGTKIIVFANTSYGGYGSAIKALKGSGKRFCDISGDNTVQEQNETISWFRHSDATEEDKKRPRILLLSFEQAAGHNLQEACHNVIIFDPMYSGTDAVADASVEEQAVGRVMRQGQKFDVVVTRIVVRGPVGERCLDDWTIERNLDEDVLRAATSNFD